MIKILELNNGIKVLLDKIDTYNSVSIGIFVSTGAKNEKKEYAGISHLLEHMMFKGTEKRTAKQISSEIDEIGGNINAYTSKEVTAYYCKVLSEHIEKAIEILSDMYLNSNFEKENFEKEKKVVIEEIKMYEDIPEDKIHDLNAENILKGTAYANSILGTEESLNSISRETLFNYYSERYNINNMVISIAGNFDELKVMDLLNKEFQAFSRKNEIKENFDFKISSGNMHFQKDINQYHLCISTNACSNIDKDRYKYSILSNVLGGNMSSRLFQKIREDKGLAYSVYTYISSYDNGGVFTAYAGTTVEDYKDVIDIMLEEFEIIKKENITEKELNKAKNQILSSNLMSLESNKNRMTRMALFYLSYKKIISVEEIIKIVKEVKLDDIKEISQNMFNKDNYFITTLGK